MNFRIGLQRPIAYVGIVVTSATLAACAPARPGEAVQVAPVNPQAVPMPLEPASAADALRGQEARAREIPLNLDLAKKKRTSSGAFLVSIRPVPSSIELNKIHSWWIRVADAAGKPADGLALRFSGGMPAHGHGFPTAPRVTKFIGNGAYLVEGVKFNMGGWWEFVIGVEAAEGGSTDEARFNLVVSE